MRYRFAPFFASMTLLSGCAVTTLGAQPQMLSPSHLKSEQAFSTAGTEIDWPKDDWWRQYGDPQMNGLVSEALANSPSVTAALARIRAAYGMLEKSRASTLPNAEVGGSIGARKIPSGAFGFSQNLTDVGGVSLSGRFDPDLWGRNKAALTAATSKAEAIRVDAQQAALILTTELVIKYADLARLYAREDVLNEALEVKQKTEHLTSQRVENGLDSQAPLRQAQSAVAMAFYDLEVNSEQMTLCRYAIAALLGAGPDRGLEIKRPNPKTLSTTGLPLDAKINLLGRRPDIVSAKLRVQSAGFNVKAAKADFYPNINLSAVLGLSTFGLSHIFDSGSQEVDIGAAISLPLFDGGFRKGSLKQASGQYDEAVANYNMSLINALREVADALTSEESAERQIIRADEALDEATSGYELTMKRYRGGLSSYLEALTAENIMLTARMIDTEAHYRRLALDVALVRALGGGFSEEKNVNRVKS